MMFEKYKERNDWEGTPTALYGEIKSIVETDSGLNINTNDRYFPKNVKSLGRHLNELIPTLKEKGLEITRIELADKLRTKIIKIRKVSPETPESQKSCSNLDNFSGDITLRATLQKSRPKILT
jgi:hypothetical protein